MAKQSNHGSSDISKDDEWILIEEKIYHLQGAKPKAKGKHALPVIGSNSDDGKEKQHLESHPSNVREIQAKDVRSSQVRRSLRTKAKPPRELISVDNLSLVTNQHGKKLVYHSSSTPLPQRFSSFASSSHKQPNSAPPDMSSAFPWPSGQENYDCVGNSVNTVKFPQTIHRKKNTKKGIEEKRLPDPQPENSLGSVPTDQKRELLYCRSAPLPQRSMFSPPHRKPNSAPVPMSSAFPWPPIEEETECVENSLNSVTFAETPARKACGKEGHEDDVCLQTLPQGYHQKIPSTNSYNKVASREGRNLVYCRSSPLPQQLPPKMSSSSASPSPRKPKSAPGKMASAFQWPAIQEDSECVENSFDSSSFAENSVSKGNAKKGHVDEIHSPQPYRPNNSTTNSFDNFAARRGRSLSTMFPSRASASPKESMPTPVEMLSAFQWPDNEEQTVHQVNTRNCLPQGCKGGGLLWRRNIKTGQWRPKSESLAYLKMPSMLDDNEKEIEAAAITRNKILTDVQTTSSPSEASSIVGYKCNVPQQKRHEGFSKTCKGGPQTTQGEELEASSDRSGCPPKENEFAEIHP